MLTIRPEQLHAFELAANARLADEFYPGMSERWPDLIEEIGEAAVHDRIRLALQEARRFHFQTKDQLLRYCNLQLALGPAFPAGIPWAMEILRRSQLSPDSQLDLLTNEVTNRVLTELIKLIEVDEEA